MRHIGWAAAAVATLAVGISGARVLGANGQDDQRGRGEQCSEATVRVGTYEISPDCTGVIRAQPLPGVSIEERLVVVDNGREIRAAVMVPTAVVITSVHQRIHGH